MAGLWPEVRRSRTVIITSSTAANAARPQLDAAGIGVGVGVAEAVGDAVGVTEGVGVAVGTAVGVGLPALPALKTSWTSVLVKARLYTSTSSTRPSRCVPSAELEPMRRLGPMAVGEVRQPL